MVCCIDINVSINTFKHLFVPGSVVRTAFETVYKKRPRGIHTTMDRMVLWYSIWVAVACRTHLSGQDWAEDRKLKTHSDTRFLFLFKIVSKIQLNYGGN